jgi:hypothetical protein
MFDENPKLKPKPTAMDGFLFKIPREAKRVRIIFEVGEGCWTEGEERVSGILHVAKGKRPIFFLLQNMVGIRKKT